MAKGQPTVPVTPAKSGGARNESSSPAARFAAATELSVSFDDEADSGPDAHSYEDYEDKTPAPEPGAATPETATLSSGLSGATRSLSRSLADELDDVAGPEPAYENYDDGTEGSKPSVASAKHSALLKAPRPPINGDTPAAKRVFDRVQALMQIDEWMQLFKPIPKKKTDWPALAQELQYPVNSVSTSQVAEDSVSLLLSLGFENETRPMIQDEDPAMIPLPPTPQRLVRTPPTKRGAERGAFGTTEASPYFQGSQMFTSNQEKKNKKKTRNMAKGQPTVPVTPAKSGGARNESSSPAARFAAATELSVSFDDEADSGPDAHDYEDYEDKTPAPEPGAATPETATLSSGLSGATRSLSRNLADELGDVAEPEPAYEDYDDGTEGSKPSVATLLKAPRPPINGDTPAAKRVFDRVQALMQSDEWIQLFKPIPKKKADWPALAQELQYPVNSVSTSQAAEDSV
ncbi:hypothetical protein PInf_027840 [Phytophthora infestans]|nr:hypothetical protein PInf_027840 [Phytophthora infestans]